MDDAELVLLELRRSGFAPTSLRVDSAAALQAALVSEPWDVVLVDHSLPGFDAPTALRLAQDYDRDLPVVVVSGMIGEELAVEMMRAGATDYVLKSNLARLAVAVEREVRDAGHRRGRRWAELLAQDVLDSLPAHVAVLDAEGRIIGVNEAWERFARANGATSESMYGIGANYLEVCRRAFGVDSAEAAPAKVGISRVLRGEVPSFSLEYPCHSPLEQRWFLLHASPLRPAGRGVVVAHTDISERKRAELVDRQLASIVESSADAIISENLDGTIASWNPAAKRLYGWTAEEAVGRHVSFLVPPEKIEEQAEILNRVLNGGQVESFETVRMHKDGTRNDVAITHSLLKDKNGRLIGMTKVVRDIRDRRRAEEAVRASEARFRKMADAAPVIIWVTDRNHSCTYLNQQWYQLTGQTEESALGFGWLGAIHPDDRQAAESMYRGACLRCEPFRLEYRLRACEGSYRWWLDTGTPQYSEDGNFIGYIGSVIDITDRRQAEEVVRSNEERFRMLASSMPQIVWVTRPDGCAEYYNPKWYTYTGLTEEKSLGSAWIQSLHPDDRARSEARWKRSTDSGDEYEIEYRLRRHDGEYRWFLGRALPQRDDSGHVVRWFGTCTDIDDLRRAEADLRLRDRAIQSVMSGIIITDQSHPNCPIIYAK